MPDYAGDFARFLQAWPSQPDAVPALDDPLANYPWARGLQPFLVPMSHQQSTPWFDPARQPNLVPLDDNPVAQAAPVPAAATPPPLPWWLDRYDAVLPDTTRVNPDPAAPVAVDVGTDQSLKAWPSDDPYVREGAYAADQAAAAKLRRPDLPGLAYYTAHPDIVAAREAGLGGIAALAGPLPAAVLAGIDYAEAARGGDAPPSAADFDQQPLKPWPSNDPYMREGAYAADQAAAAKLRRPDLPGLAYGHRPDVRAARDAAFAAMPSMLPGGKLGVLGGRTTRFGVVRNSPAAWRELRDLWDSAGYGEILSEANRAKIAARRAPIVDEAWIAYFSEDAGLTGEVITIHHIGGGLMITPLPWTRHQDAHSPRGTRWNVGGPGSAAPLYLTPPVKK
jgi:hypothetical protein